MPSRTSQLHTCEKKIEWPEHIDSLQVYFGIAYLPLHEAQLNRPQFFASSSCLTPIDLWNRRSRLNLNQKVSRQRADLESRSGRLWVGQEVSVDFVHSCKVRDICQHDCGLQRILPGCTGFLKDGSDICEDLTLWGVSSICKGGGRGGDGLL